ncbi:lipopolysaccharide-induced tumor necrosis factor-alpha factor homolog [Hyposmocoma kahamanoa]|uniref:lipopolysaccharide-induced tumor necrosis factor-alpha factor homolog n=1 Tax=Hyposmocoma kahamanoa TaxID=1477025 RepID=UPI000E6D76DE|nr:lipopolysaccharide-induced tumor necrosis factor-alpha factor homolog [Hyposmocoma kahamanoa]
MDMSKEQGHASVYPSSGEPYHPPAPPSYDAVTSSSAPPQVHTASPQYVNTGPTIITTGPQVYRAGPTIITTQPVFTPTVMAVLGSSPSLTVCRVCNCQVLTRVDSEPSMMTHLCAGILCITGLWPCVCLPYCMGSCYNNDHYCSNCNAHIGRSQNY